jgi:hypothetical protein
MQKAVEIENIEAMRFNEAIDDIELKAEIRSLVVGDFVRLTFLTGSPPKGETQLVQITSIEGRAFSGRLSRKSAVTGQSSLRAGTVVTFTSAHIHSVPKGGLSQDH